MKNKQKKKLWEINSLSPIGYLRNTYFLNPGITGFLPVNHLYRTTNPIRVPKPIIDAIATKPKSTNIGATSSVV